MKRNIIATGTILLLIAWSCTKVDTQPQGLKQSIETYTANINTAISKISASKGYELLSASADPTARAEEVFRDSITLAKIAGIYDYQPDTIFHGHHAGYPFRLFKKTGTSDMMIVNLPERLMFHPRYLHNFNLSDSVPANNFTISASGYHFYYNWWNNLDYRLNAALTLNSADIGSVDVSAVSTSFKDQSYSSAFTFTEGYSISTSWQTGDTTESSFALLKDNGILLKETSDFTGNEFHRHERRYSVTIGNIEIRRGFGIDSIQVYQDGVLQNMAGTKITDSADSTGSICGRRDILLTFNDGTTAKLSDLISPALTQLKALVSSLHDMYFAERIVDYIAVNIYYNSR